MKKESRATPPSGAWTQFMDMNSGGGRKLKWSYIYIEAPEKEAAVIFQNRFKRNPHRVTCTCCGNDYSLSEAKTLAEATAFNRGCAFVYRDESGNEVPKDKAWIPGKGTAPGVKGGYEERGGGRLQFRQYMPLKEYLKDKSVKVIYARDIKAAERKGELNEEGYVWRD